VKLTVVLEFDVSKSMAETITRTGFELAPDGSAMQVKVPNAPTIPKRKVKCKFFENVPMLSLVQGLADGLDGALHQSNGQPVDIGGSHKEKTAGANPKE
jgi:hypothetical protein